MRGLFLLASKKKRNLALLLFAAAVSVGLVVEAIVSHSSVATAFYIIGAMGFAIFAIIFAIAALKKPDVP
jgi:bacteriorhodopsin